MKERIPNAENIPYQYDKELRFKVTNDFFKSVEGLSIKEIENIVENILHELSSFKRNIPYNAELSKKMLSEIHETTTAEGIIIPKPPIS
ncbi:hypothetical protein [Fluviicola taffensis]|uniref:Uncharacterized protein n=1 Tax=Fluviicola taffensis (strain DSM 16823 / NCIMB 13979 / RW262) TaxID=755732 RepID=F2IHD2_FLUTR|nr:hypothetical protein [Fluviicola taffensis]AEA42687.1 hypothetical protein Fluta_0683 [Fluviicola taffensis DSM 16823]